MRNWELGIRNSDVDFALCAWVFDNVNPYLVGADSIRPSVKIRAAVNPVRAQGRDCSPQVASAYYNTKCNTP